MAAATLVVDRDVVLAGENPADQDPWTDPITNPYGCCATHRVVSSETIQVHGAAGCWWPTGPKVGDRVSLRTIAPTERPVHGTVDAVDDPGYNQGAVNVRVVYDNDAHEPTFGPLRAFAKLG